MPQSSFFEAVRSVTAGGAILAEVIAQAEALAAEGRPTEAAELYRVWLGFHPTATQAHAAQFNLSVLAEATGDLEGAEQALRAAVALAPEFLPAYINLGNLLERRNDPKEALGAWGAAVEQAAAVTPERVAHKSLALKRIGRALMDLKALAPAEEALRACAELQPQQPDVLAHLVQLRMSQSRWPAVQPSAALPAETLVRHMQPLSLAAYVDDPWLQLAGAHAYLRQEAGAPTDTAADRRHARTDLAGRRARIGYVSSDLCDHAVGWLMTELFERHDRAGFEVFAYACGPDRPSPITDRIRAAVEHWIDITPMDDAAAAARIAADAIDVLVDVNGHTRLARHGVFARRPAPVQVNWLGFPGSTASPFHHYIIADEWIIPPHGEPHYTEQVVRLPCYQPNDTRRVVAPAMSRAEAGLPEAAFVFCCFNGAQKITPPVLNAWLHILLGNQNAVLWLLDCGPESSAAIHAYAAAAGVSPERIIFAPRLSSSAHLSRYPLADLFLDTFPYGAHTTSSDALWAGVPILTVSGVSFASRVCGSLVRAAGLPELVCDSLEAYVARALDLSARPDALAALRERLVQGRQSCVLFDMAGLTARLQDIYRQMCATHERGQTPRPDLRNLDTYLEVGSRLVAEAGPAALGDEAYRKELARLHLARPLPPDARLWTPADITAAEPPPA